MADKRAVLITGASSGLGKYTADEFLRHGDIVYGTSRASVDAITLPSGATCSMLQLDVQNAANCQSVIEQIVAAQGKIDVLINSAGFGIAGALEMTDDTEIAKQLDVNLMGAIRMMRAALPHMRKTGGKIINISSVAAPVPIPFQAMYSASKAALESVSQSMGMEVKPFHVAISCIEFGDMKTGFTQNRVTTAGTFIDSQADRLYSAAFERSIKRMETDEKNGPLPLKAAALIYKVTTKRHAKPIYVCGLSYRLIALIRRILPYRLTNSLIGKMYS